MPLLDFQTAFGDAEQACVDAPPQSAGFRFTVAVQRSWCARRAVNAGLLALSILRDDTRRRLLDAWIHSGAGTSAFFAVEADALLDYIAEQLPDPSAELTLCRFEQLTLRANHRAGFFKAPDRALFDPQRLMRRAHHAGVLVFHGKPDLLLNALLQRKPLPGFSLEVTALLIAPGLQPLCRIATAHEKELWMALTMPTVAADLLGDGFRRDVMQTLLHVGALEYA
jgi:hypothetical protein